MSRKNLFQLLTVAPYIRASYIIFSQKFLHKFSIFSSDMQVRKCIGFSIYWSSRGTGRRYFTKQTLVNAISFLMNKCFVTLLVKWFLNKILVYQLVLTQHHFGPTSFFISLNLSM